MTYRKSTKIIIIVLLILLVAYDILAACDPQACNTLSCVLLEWVRKYPTVNFCVGVLCGHLFWPQHIKNKKVID